jgi:Fe-S cluster assembly iron-binding protein IscA
VRITERAKKQLIKISKKKASGSIRLEILRGCCAEIPLFESAPREKGDGILYGRGIKIYVSRDDCGQMQNAVIDYDDGGFLINS